MGAFSMTPLSNVLGLEGSGEGELQTGAPKALALQGRIFLIKNLSAQPIKAAFRKCDQNSL